MKKMRRTTRQLHTLGILSIILTILIGAAISVFVFKTFTRESKDDIGLNLLLLARSGASMYDGESFAHLFFHPYREISSNQIKPYYLELKNDNNFQLYLSRLENFIGEHASSGLSSKNLYVFSRDPLEPTRLVRWALSENESLIGDPYVMTDDMKKVLAGYADYSNGAFSDLYLSTASDHTWMSAYAPIRDDNNRVVGIFEAAYPVEEVLAQTEAEARRAVYIILAFVVFVLFIGIVIVRYTVISVNTQSDLELTASHLSHAEARFNNLVVQSNEIIISLDENNKILMVNNALKSHLGIRPSTIIGKSVFDVLFRTDDSFTITEKKNLQESIRLLMEKGKAPRFSLSLNSTNMEEPKLFEIQMEHIITDAGEEILLKAIPADDDSMTPYFQSETQELAIDNYLTLADTLSHRLTRYLTRFVTTSEARELRVSIREMLLNAVEHGNLNINFEEKTQALISDSYLDLIRERRENTEYANRRVHVSHSIYEKAFSVVIRDEGDGFDWKSRLEADMVENNETMMAHGRGIAMSQEVFDEISYNEKGNEVTLIKHFTQKNKNK